MKTKTTVLTAMFLATSVAVACGEALPLPIPPVPIKLGLTDLARAALQGYQTNAGYAAAMMKLDSLGKQAVGEDKRYANSYGGYFTYSVSGGANTMYVEKSCDQYFIDNAPKTEESLGGGGAIGCGGTASVDYGIVGWSQQTRTYTVCTAGVCSTGTYTEVIPIYGNLVKSEASVC